MINFQILTELRFFKTTVDIIKFVHENENVVKEEISTGKIEKSKIATELAGPDS